MKIVKIMLVVAPLFVATACVGPMELVNTLGYFFVDGVTEAKTGKGLIDNTVSTVLSQDCKVKNIFKDGGNLCNENKNKNMNKGVKDGNLHNRDSDSKVNEKSRLEK